MQARQWLKDVLRIRKSEADYTTKIKQIFFKSALHNFSCKIVFVKQYEIHEEIQLWQKIVVFCFVFFFSFETAITFTIWRVTILFKFLNSSIQSLLKIAFCFCKFRERWWKLDAQFKSNDKQVTRTKSILCQTVICLKTLTKIFWQFFSESVRKNGKIIEEIFNFFQFLFEHLKTQNAFLKNLELQRKFLIIFFKAFYVFYFYNIKPVYRIPHHLGQQL